MIVLLMSLSLVVVQDERGADVIRVQPLETCGPVHGLRVQHRQLWCHAPLLPHQGIVLLLCLLALLLPPPLLSLFLPLSPLSLALSLPPSFAPSLPPDAYSSPKACRLSSYILVSNAMYFVPVLRITLYRNAVTVPSRIRWSRRFAVLR